MPTTKLRETSVPSENSGTWSNGSGKSGSIATTERTASGTTCSRNWQNRNYRVAGFKNSNNVLEAYKAERIDAKPNTIAAWNTSIKLMVGYFGDVPLRTISNEQAALFRVHLVKKGYATAYISKSIMIARTFFNVAHRRKLIDDNPFRYVETGSQVNKDRFHDETDHLINACTNAKQRLIIALGRDMPGCVSRLH